MSIKDSMDMQRLGDMIPPRVKALSGKLRGKDTSNGTVTLRTGTWVAQNSEKYKNEIQRKGQKKVRSDMEEREMLAKSSMAKDMFLEKILQSKKYTFKYMLAVRNPFQIAPLTALLLFYTKEAVKVRYRVVGDAKEVDVVEVTEKAQYHRIPVWGMYANRKNTIIVELLNDDNQVTDKKKIQIPTSELPDYMQDLISVDQMKQETAEHFYLVSGGIDIHTCIFDSRGDIRYYITRPVKGYGIFPMSKGHFLFLEKSICAYSYTVPHTVQMHDMDYLGRVHKTYFVENGVHHFACEKVPGGNLMIAGSTLQDHCENTVAEIDRNTGEVVRQLVMDEALYNTKYMDMIDWVHVNSVTYNEKEDTVLVSMRNIHAAAKFNWTTGELLWVMADKRAWEGTEIEDKVLEPIGETPFFFQQHSVFQQDVDLDGNPDTIHVAVFDNHVAARRKSPLYDDLLDSYINLYTINEKKMTIELTKQFTCDRSKIRSNQVFEFDKHRLFIMAGFYVPTIDGNLGAVCEYDYDSGEMLNRIFVKPGYFTAYPFHSPVADLTTKMDIDEEYLVGNLDCFEPFEGEVNLSKAKLIKEEELFLWHSEDILAVNCFDHTIHYVYLVNGDKIYYVDFTKTHQIMKQFLEMSLNIVMSMKDVPMGSYHIFVDFKGELLDMNEDVILY